MTIIEVQSQQDFQPVVSTWFCPLCYFPFCGGLLCGKLLPICFKFLCLVCFGSVMKHALGDRELNRSGDRTGDLFGWCSEGSCRVKRDWAIAGGCKVLWYILKMFS